MNLFLILLLFAPTLLAVGRATDCNFSDLCGSNNGGGIANWYKEGKVYRYVFHTKVELDLSHKSGVGVADQGNVEISGELEVIRGQGCTSSFKISNATATMSEIEGERTELDLWMDDGKVVFPYMSGPGKTIELCLPEGEDKWKSNVRRALALHLASAPPGCTPSTQGGTVMNGVHCKHIQEISEFYQLTANVTTQTEIKFLGTSDKLNSRKDDSVSLFHTTSEFDNGPNGATNCDKVLDDFDKFVSKLCSNILNPFSLLNYGESMRRILPLIPVHVLKEKWEWLTNNPCVEGLENKAFLDMVAKAPSDDTVEFVVDLIQKDEIDSDIFQTFLWVAAMQPIRNSHDGDFVRYAGPRSVQAMKNLLNTDPTKYGMSESQFLLNMLAFRNKILNPSQASTPQREYDNQLVMKSENENTVDTATKLEISYAMQLNDFNASDNCQDIPNDFQKLMCYSPCDLSHSQFLRELLNNPNKHEDLKIFAYLHMRKCYGEEWKRIVNEFQENPDSNEDVKSFINQHLKQVAKAYPDETENNIEETGLAINNFDEIEQEEQVSPEISKYGQTFFFTRQIQKIYGKDNVTATFEGNLVKGKSIFPRMASLELKTISTQGIKQMNYKFEILRLDSNDHKTSEYLLTVRQNVVAIYTQTIKLNHDQIIKWIQEGGDGMENVSQKILPFIKDKILLQLFKNHNILKPITTKIEQEEQTFNSFGLPLKSGSTTIGLFSLNYTIQTTKRNIINEVVHTLRLNPAVALQERKYVSIGLGHNEAQGYQLVSDGLLQFNVEIQLSSLNGPQRKNAKVRLSFKNPNSESDIDSHAVHLQTEAHLLSRFQFVNSYTTFRATKHIYLDEIEPERPIQGILDLGQYSALLNNHTCVSEVILEGFLFEDSALHIGVQKYCEVPTLTLELEHVFEPGTLSYGIKLYPDDITTQGNHYEGKISFSNNTEKKQIGAQILYSSPKGDYELGAKVSLDIKDVYLKIFYNQAGKNFGFEVYGQFEKEDADVLDYNYLENLNKMGYLSFGVKAWSPFEGYENITILRGGLNATRSFSIATGFVEIDLLKSRIDFNQLIVEKNVEETVLFNEKPANIFVSKLNASFALNSIYLGQWKAEIEKFWGGEIEKHHVNGNRIKIFTMEADAYLLVLEENYNSFAKFYSLSEDDDDALKIKEWLSGNIIFPNKPSWGLTFKKVFETIHGNEADCGEFREKRLEVQVTPKEGSSYSLKTSRISLASSDSETDILECKEWNGNDYYEVQLANHAVFKLHLGLDKKAYNFQNDGEKLPKYVKLLEIGSNCEKEQFQLYCELNREKGELYINGKYNRSMGKILFDSTNTFKEDAEELKYEGRLTLQKGTEKEYIFTIDGLTHKKEEIKITIGNKKWIEPILVSFKKVTDENSYKSFKLNVEDKQKTYFDSSIKFLKDQSQEGYVFGLKAHAPKIFDIRTDIGPGILSSVLEASPINLKLQTKIKWRFGGNNITNYFLNMKGDARLLSNHEIIIKSWNSFTELEKYSEKSNFIKMAFGNSTNDTPNPLFISNSTISGGGFLQKLDIFFELFPQDQRSPSVKFSFIDDENKFQINLERQFLLKSPKTCEIRQWLTVETPCNKKPFKIQEEIIFTNKDLWSYDREASLVNFQRGWDLKYNFETEFSHLLGGEKNYDFNFNFNSSMLYNGHASYKGPKEEPDEYDFEYLSYTMKTNYTLELDLKPLNDAKFQQRSFSVEAVRPEKFGTTLFNWKYNATLRKCEFNVRLANVKKYLGFKPTKYIEDELEENEDTISTEIDWAIFHQENNLDGEVTLSEFNRGIHKATRFSHFDWENFEMTSCHEVNISGRKYTFSDKLFTNLRGFFWSEYSCGYVSNILELTSFVRPGEMGCHFKIHCEPLKTDISARLELTPISYFNDQFEHQKYIFESLFSNNFVPLFYIECDLAIRNQSDSEKDWKISLYHDTPLDNSPCNFSSHLKLRRLEDENGIFATYLTQRMITERGSDITKFTSVSSIMYKNDFPLFVHYDFEHSVDEGSLSMRGSFSASAPNLKNAPTILQLKLEDQRPSHNARFFEALYRVGQLDKQKCILPKSELSDLVNKQDSISLVDLQTFYNSKLNCPRYRLSPNQIRLDLGKADGHFVLQAVSFEHDSSPADPLNFLLEDSDNYHQRGVQAMWNEDKCSAVEWGRNVEIIDQSETCAATLPLLNPCWTHPNLCNETIGDQNRKYWAQRVNYMSVGKMNTFGGVIAFIAPDILT